MSTRPFPSLLSKSALHQHCCTAPPAFAHTAQLHVAKSSINQASRRLSPYCRKLLRVCWPLVLPIVVAQQHLCMLTHVLHLRGCGSQIYRHPYADIRIHRADHRPGEWSWVCRFKQQSPFVEHCSSVLRPHGCRQRRVQPECAHHRMPAVTLANRRAPFPFIRRHQRM